MTTLGTSTVVLVQYVLYTSLWCGNTCKSGCNIFEKDDADSPLIEFIKNVNDAVGQMEEEGLIPEHSFLASAFAKEKLEVKG